MQHITKFAEQKTQSNVHNESRMNTSATDQLLARLHRGMKTAYGGLFTATVATPEDLKMWETLWKVSLGGKDREASRKTLMACFLKYEKPFTPAAFEKIYKDLRPLKMHQKNDEALALPKGTYLERKGFVAEYLEKIKKQLRENGS